MLCLGFLKPRFWCKYVCPSGAIFSLGNLFRATERKVESSCIHCNKCVEICPFDAINVDVKHAFPESAIVIRTGPGREDRLIEGSYRKPSPVSAAPPASTTPPADPPPALDPDDPFGLGLPPGQ